jgi:hypothetical protein
MEEEVYISSYLSLYGRELIRSWLQDKDITRRNM